MCPLLPPGQVLGLNGESSLVEDDDEAIIVRTECIKYTARQSAQSTSWNLLLK